MRDLRSAGFTLLEIMITIGVVGVTLYGLLGGADFIEYHTSKTRNAMALERTVLQIVDSIRSGPHLYQITFNPNDFFNNITKEKLEKMLPMAWDEYALYSSIDECHQVGRSGCSGRLGYILTPLTGYRGIYRLIVRVSHPKMIKGLYQDFPFIIRGM
ncbi:MAG: type II secretion system protein [Bdellovibrionales bacterium]|jgi:prepilin-type N-terminal cleavage/methylation domain-containing protein|nr:type II secretion system protein [Bdellovibrionales bacterium]MBT3525430.1 type II secretion system protein [Bdellovibrionales bacterium]MBT7668155.1 type II secretion system protein [Bdellovibrionales bacterium]MBT7766969.1 type II secretion system protein [Bdellovibrionales bacterium]